MTLCFSCQSIWLQNQDKMHNRCLDYSESPSYERFKAATHIYFAFQLKPTPASKTLEVDNVGHSI